MNRSSFCMLIVSLFAITLVEAKPARPRYEPEIPPQLPTASRNLVGTYALSQRSDAARSGAMMKIWGQVGNTFSVAIAQPLGNPALDWEGRGVIHGDQGHYDWVFPDGKKGRTTFTIDKDGVIHAQVRGGGIDWDYVGIRVVTTR